MSLLLAVARISLILLWTLAWWSVRLLFWPLKFWDEPRDRRWRRLLARPCARGILRLMGGRVRVEGTPPAPPFYLVANHLSYIDIFLITSQTGAGFVARGDMQNWPLIGLMCRSLYILFIDRSSKRDAARVNELIAHTLAMSDGITVFAESRISRGLDVEPFKSALIQPALLAGVPVHHAAISYRSLGPLPANQMVGWWRPEPLGYHLRRLLQQPGFEAIITFGEAPVSAPDRKQLCRQLHQEVRQNFQPVA